jgi:hypothetical protein
MIPTHQLLDLYQQWKALTEEEGAAILASDWEAVARCQKKKQLLQPLILRASESQNAGNGESSKGDSYLQDRIREAVNELIQLETKNSATLSERITTANAKRDNLNRTSKQLRQVHRSYVPAQGSVWNQYS